MGAMPAPTSVSLGFEFCIQSPRDDMTRSEKWLSKYNREMDEVTAFPMLNSMMLFWLERAGSVFAKSRQQVSQRWTPVNLTFMVVIHIIPFKHDNGETACDLAVVG
jgi:hypothetical protein